MTVAISQILYYFASMNPPNAYPKISKSHIWCSLLADLKAQRTRQYSKIYNSFAQLFLDPRAGLVADVTQQIVLQICRVCLQASELQCGLCIATPVSTNVYPYLLITRASIITSSFAPPLISVGIATIIYCYYYTACSRILDYRFNTTPGSLFWNTLYIIALRSFQRFDLPTTHGSQMCSMCLLSVNSLMGNILEVLIFQMRRLILRLSDLS